MQDQMVEMPEREWPARMSLAEMAELGMEYLETELQRVLPGVRGVEVAAFQSTI